jgi:hypothetical protein
VILSNSEGCEFTIFPAAEGGADQWERPALPFIDDEHESIIFQQIDIEQYIANGDKPMLRMFGVTEVRAKNTKTDLIHLTGSYFLIRRGTVFWHTYLASCHTSMSQFPVVSLRRRTLRDSRSISMQVFAPQSEQDLIAP